MMVVHGSGPPENCKIIIYLIHQLAQDIATVGNATFEMRSPGFVAFLQGDNNNPKLSLFRELAKMAKEGKWHNPATDPGIKQAFCVQTRQIPEI